MGEMKRDVENLIEVYVNHHKRDLKLLLGYNNLSKAFENKWERRYEGRIIIDPTMAVWSLKTFEKVQLC